MASFFCRFVTMFLAMVAAPSFAAPNHIAPELAAESITPAPGKDISLALAMTPSPGWHGYWQNPGDAGVETRIGWTLPRGVTVGDLHYPVPDTLVVAGLMNYVFEGPYAHLMTLHVPEGLTPGTPLPIRAKVDYLACTREICVPETADLAIDLKVGDGAVTPAASGRFDRWRMGLPKPLGSEARFALAGDRLRIAVPIPTSVTPVEPYFFAQTDGVLNYAAPQAITRNGDAIIIETAARSATLPRSFDGVLRIAAHEGLQFHAERGNVPAAGTPLTPAGRKGEGDAGPRAILVALAGAIVGGLLLNVMPCVFPILSLKALELTRVHAAESSARRDALAYTAGVVLVCVGLGALLLALRAGGLALGWAFQLQDPRVILLLLLLVTAIALNLAGLFELPVLAGWTGGRGAMGSFWTGALAAFIATPCTGPFMGVALGAALVLPAVIGLTIFAGLGLGLALPFLLLGFVPRFRMLLPKPGAWMERFRHVLALPMFATALGLAWILGRQAGVDAMTLGLAAALTTGAALWWLGRRQAAGHGGGWWPVAIALVTAVGLAAILPQANAAVAASTSSSGNIEPFSETRLTELRAQNRPVFLYFTADWCLTCKVNEKTAIERAEVEQSFRRHKIAVMVGDWTRGDPVISRFLAANGRSGVPLYLYYRPGAQSPDVLPQVLTPSLLIGLPA